MKLKKIFVVLLAAIVTAVSLVVPASAAAKIKPPTDMAVSVKSETSVSLSWDKVTGAKKYEVYYSKNESKNYKLYKTTTKTNLTVKKLKTDTTYYFKVRALDKNGKKSKFSRVMSATPHKIIKSDVELTAISEELAQDYKGEYFLLVTYKFKQNTTEPKSFYSLVDDTAYQNGIELSDIIVSDALDNSYLTKVMPGVEFEVQRGYKLRDFENDVVIYSMQRIKDYHILTLTVTM